MDKITHVKNVALASAGMAIKTSSSALAKTVNAFNYTIDGNIIGAKGAGDLPALTGINVADGYTTCITVSINSSGTFSLTESIADQLTSGLTGIFPISALGVVPAGNALVGYIVIKNATGSVFTGGTTALDVSNLTVTYLNAVGGFTV